MKAEELPAVALVLTLFPGTEIVRTEWLEARCGWCGETRPPHADCDENVSLWLETMARHE